jgi:hypothetical protein
MPLYNPSSGGGGTPVAASDLPTLRGEYNLKAFGAALDGTTADDSAWAAAATFFNGAGGGTLVIPKGTTKLTATNGPLFTVPMRLRFDDRAIISAPNIAVGTNSADTAAALRFSGSRSTGVTTLSGGAAQGAITATVTSATSISAGQWIVIRTTSTVFNSDRPTVYYTTEWQKVKSKSGNTLTFWQPLRASYPSGAAIDTYTMLGGVQIEGSIWQLGGTPDALPQASGAGSLEQIGVAFQYAEQVTVEGLTIKNAEMFGLYCYCCIDIRGDEVSILESNQSGLGYGVRLTGCESATFAKLYGRGNRHTFDAEMLSTVPISRHIKVIGGSFRGDYSAAISTHGGCEFAEFVANDISGCGGGIVTRAKSALVQSNKIYGSHNSGGESYYHGVMIGDGVGANTPSVGAGPSGTYLQVLDNEIDLSSNNGATVAHAIYAHAPLIDATVGRNKLRNFTGTGVLLEGDVTTRTDIDANDIATSRQISSSYHGIALIPANAVSGNVQTDVRVRRNLIGGTILGAAVKVTGNATNAASSSNLDLSENIIRSYGTYAFDLSNGYFGADIRIRNNDLPSGSAATLVNVTPGNFLAGAPTIDGNRIGGTLYQDEARWQPGYNKLLAASFDPGLAVNASPTTNGVISLVKLAMPRSLSVTNILASIGTGGSTLTAGQNFAAIYDDSGNRLGVTADQATAWQSTGVKTMAISGGPVVVPGGPGRYCFVALLSNGTTPPQFHRTTNNAALNNVGLAATDGYRSATSGTGQTSMPATITIGSTASANTLFWVGLS